MQPKIYQPETAGQSVTHYIHQFEYAGIARSYFVESYIDDVHVASQICFGKRQLARYLDRFPS